MYIDSVRRCLLIVCEFTVSDLCMFLKKKPPVETSTGKIQLVHMKSIFNEYIFCHRCALCSTTEQKCTFVGDVWSARGRQISSRTRGDLNDPCIVLSNAPNMAALLSHIQLRPRTFTKTPPFHLYYILCGQKDDRGCKTECVRLILHIEMCAFIVLVRRFEIYLRLLSVGGGFYFTLMRALSEASFRGEKDLCPAGDLLGPE